MKENIFESNSYIENEFEYYLNEGVISEVLGLVNVGKEAEVYLAKLKEGDGDNRAYRLADLRHNIEDPKNVLDQIVENMKICFKCGVVHGDLSPFNILYHRGKVVLIDFPQSVREDKNRLFFDLFKRDCKNVTNFFKKFGINRNIDDEILHRYDLF